MKFGHLDGESPLPDHGCWPLTSTGMIEDGSYTHVSKHGNLGATGMMMFPANKNPNMARYFLFFFFGVVRVGFEIRVLRFATAAFLAVFGSKTIASKHGEMEAKQKDDDQWPKTMGLIKNGQSPPI